MAIEKKLICFARLEEFERQLAAGNILDYSIVFIQDAKKIWNRGTYYDCSGEYYAEVYGDTYIGTSVEGTEVYLTTNVAENLDAVSARGQLADAYDIKTFVENAVQGGGGITAETDPVFSASPAASITEEKKTEWDNKVDKVSGKQLSTHDFTTELEGKLKGIEANAQKNVQSDWSENDTDSDTYVNNRTHYSYDIEQVTTFSIASKNEGDILVTGLLAGAFYRIYNNAGGKNEAFHFVEGRKVIIPSKGPIIEAVCAYEDDYCLKLTTTTYGMTESFILKEIYVEQLDDVYVPETVARKAEIATINGQSLTEGGDITIEGGSGSVTDVQVNGTSVVSDGVATIRKATVALYGVTKLSTSVSSTSNETVPTSGTIKKVYDLANGKQDALESGTNIKTINGESILGSGNISISGGSGGGSSAYSEVNHGTSDTTFTLTPNTFHVWDEVSALTLTLGSETSGVANEYLFQFTSGAAATSLTLPDDIKWANDSAPTIAENMIYQVSILKGLASVLEFSNALALIENKVTMSISGTKYLVSLQYAAASDIVVKVRTLDGAISVSILSGEISKTASPMGPMIDSSAYIESITPEMDATYIYTW